VSLVGLTLFEGGNLQYVLRLALPQTKSDAKQRLTRLEWCPGAAPLAADLRSHEVSSIPVTGTHTVVCISKTRDIRSVESPSTGTICTTVCTTARYGPDMPIVGQSWDSAVVDVS